MNQYDKHIWLNFSTNKIAKELSRLLTDIANQNKLNVSSNLLKSFNQYVHWLQNSKNGKTSKLINSLPKELTTKILTDNHELEKIQFTLGVNYKVSELIPQMDNHIYSHDGAQAPYSNPQNLAPLQFIALNLRSLHNIGSLIRLANGVAVTQVNLCGFSYDLNDKKIAKTALGSEKQVKIEMYSSFNHCVTIQKKNGSKVIALETSQEATILPKVIWQPGTAIAVANERCGFSPQELALVDEIVSIPMWGNKNSLNVIQALSVASYHFRLQLL